MKPRALSFALVVVGGCIAYAYYVRAQQSSVPALSPAQSCPPYCKVIDGYRMTTGSMNELRHAAWDLLLPFTQHTEGLPTAPEWHSVTSIRPPPPPPAASSAGIEPLGAAGATKTAALEPKFPQFALELPRAAGLAPGQPKVYEAAYVNSTVWNVIEHLETTDEQQRRHVRELELPPKAMAIKLFFYRVRKGEKTPVRLWDWAKVRVTKEADLDDSGMERRCVTADSSVPGCVAARDSFYTVLVTDKLVFKCVPNCENDLANGDLLILVGMHIASKQTPEWLWATFWWRGKDQETLSGEYWTCQTAQRPESITKTDRWNNYSMDATASFQLLKPAPKPGSKDALCGVPPTLGDTGDPRQADQSYLAAYNPFAEAGLVNGLKSNCVNCHSRATTSLRALPLPPGLEDTDSPYLKDFEGHIRLDYLWSLRRALRRTGWPPTG